MKRMNNCKTTLLIKKIHFETLLPLKIEYFNYKLINKCHFYVEYIIIRNSNKSIQISNALELIVLFFKIRV